MKKKWKRLLCLGMAVSMATGTLASVSAAEDEEKVLRLSSNISHVTFDIYNSHQTYNTSMVLDWFIYYDGAGNFEPWVCTEWDVAEDGMSATFTIRDDIYFQSGNHMTSADVQGTYMRIVNDRTLANAKTFAALENVEIVDDYTVEFEMNTAWPTLLDDIAAYPVLDMAKLEEMGDDAFFQNPSGAGPFQVVDFDPVNSTYELERYENWWGWDVVDNATNIDRIYYTNSSEDTTRVSALRTGEFDMIELVPFDDVELLEESGFQVLQTSENRHVMLGMSYNGIFADESLREAASLAIDRDLIVETVIGTGTPAVWPWSSGLAYNPDAEGYECDMEKAQELVAASDYDGSEITLLTSSSTTTRVNELAQAVQSMLMEAGFNVKINMVEEATYDTLRPAGEYDLAIGVFNTTSGDGYKEICEIIGGDIFGTGYVDEELTELVAEVEGNVDTDSRQQAEWAVYQHIMDHFGPYLYLYTTTGIVAANEKLDLDSIYMDGSGTWRIFRAQVN